MRVKTPSTPSGVDRGSSWTWREGSWEVEAEEEEEEEEEQVEKDDEDEDHDEIVERHRALIVVVTSETAAEAAAFRNAAVERSMTSLSSKKE